ncbi:MAG: carbohydrate kinase [Betaproteobacteria bacterium]|nr:carbohydrate kinase [Betaproteobacteria bacterium]
MSDFLPGRVLPRAPVGDVVALFGEIVVDVFPDRQVPGGSPFNVARHLRAFGLHPVLISRIGSDSAREITLDAMRRFDLDMRGIQRDSRRATGRVVFDKNGVDPRFEIGPGQAHEFINGSVARLVARGVAPCVVYFGTLAPRASGSRQALEVVLRNSGALRFLDLNLRAPWCSEETVQRSLLRADTAKVSVTELEQVAKLLHLAGGDEPTWAASLLARFSLARVVVTRGERGAWLLQSDGTRTFVEGQGECRQMVDTVGAGDAFSAILLLGILRDWPVETTLARADAFARAVCAMPGAVPADEEFYRPFLSAWNSETPHFQGMGAGRGGPGEAAGKGDA